MRQRGCTDPEVLRENVERVRDAGASGGVVLEAGTRVRVIATYMGGGKGIVKTVFEGRVVGCELTRLYGVVVSVRGPDGTVRRVTGERVRKVVK